MNIWKWLTTADPSPTFTRSKLLKILARTLLFVVVATFLQFALRAAGLGRYLDTWWGTVVVVLVVYIPFYRLMTLDTLVAPPPARTGRGPGSGAKQVSQMRVAKRAEKNRFAGVKKGMPKTMGGRR